MEQQTDLRIEGAVEIPRGPCVHRLGMATVCRAPQPNSRWGGGSRNAGHLTSPLWLTTITLAYVSS